MNRHTVLDLDDVSVRNDNKFFKTRSDFHMNLHISYLDGRTKIIGWSGFDSARVMFCLFVCILLLKYDLAEYSKRDEENV